MKLIILLSMFLVAIPANGCCKRIKCLDPKETAAGFCLIGLVTAKDPAQACCFAAAICCLCCEARLKNDKKPHLLKTPVLHLITPEQVKMIPLETKEE